MNNIHAEVDEIFRTNNKKAVVSLFLSMQGNYIRAVEAEARLTKVQAEIERKDAMIERLRSTLACARPYVADSDSLSTKRMLDTVDAALAAAEGGE